MKKKLLVSVLLLAMVSSVLTGYGGEEKQEEPEEIVYLEESEIDSLFTNPDEYAGKYVKLSGQLLDAPETDGEITAIQAWHDIENYSQNFIIQTDAADGIENQDYVWVDGKIDGTFSGENAFGGSVECPLIVDATVTKGSYMEIVVPTIAEITPAASQDQNGIVVTVDKVEYAENETRVYVTINNGTDYNFSCGTYSAKLLIDGKQIDQDNMSQTLYNSPELSELSYEVMAGTSSSGTLIFPAIEQGVAFQFILPDAYSENYDLMFTNYMIDVPVQ